MVLYLTGFVFLIPIAFAWLYPPLANIKVWQYLFLALLGIFFLYNRKRHQSLELRAVSNPALAFFFLAGLLAFVTTSLLRYQAFRVNGIDFSIFDWLLYSLSGGLGADKFMWAPFCDCNHFGVHPTYVLFPLGMLHRLFSSPYFLVLTHPLALWIAGWPLYKLALHYLKQPVFAAAVVACYFANGWTSSILNYGFHVEAFFLPFGIAMILAWVKRQPWLFWLWALLFLSIKEDAAFYLGAFSVGVLLFEPARRREGAAIFAVAASFCAINLGLLQPYFRGFDAKFGRMPAAQPAFMMFWEKYGHGPAEILVNMLKNPLTPLYDIATSQWYLLFGAALFLPFLSKTPLMAMLPAIFLLGTSANSSMRSFGLYYAAPLLPFFFWSLLCAWQRLPRMKTLILSLSLILISIAKGSTISFPVVDKSLHEDFAKISAIAAQELKSSPRVFCVQAALFPHMPYDRKILPLDEACLRRELSIGLIHPGLDPFPYDSEQIEKMMELKPVRRQFPSGFVLLQGR